MSKLPHNKNPRYYDDLNIASVIVKLHYDKNLKYYHDLEYHLGY